MKILIAEDDDSSRRLLEKVLRRQQHDPVAYSDGAEALHALQKDDAPRLAILDWEMPGKTGLQICQELRANPTPTPIYAIMLTSHRDREKIVEALQSGANDYITKPFHSEELQARVQVGVRTVELQQELSRRVKELEDAAAREKRLFELLPMCAWCRKIRNDENYWNDLESFLTKSGVKISHGVCPDCAVKVREQWAQQWKQMQAEKNDHP